MTTRRIDEINPKFESTADGRLAIAWRWPDSCDSASLLLKYRVIDLSTNRTQDHYEMFNDPVVRAHNQAQGRLERGLRDNQRNCVLEFLFVFLDSRGGETASYRVEMPLYFGVRKKLVFQIRKLQNAESAYQVQVRAGETISKDLLWITYNSTKLRFPMDISEKRSRYLLHNIRKGSMLEIAAHELIRCKFDIEKVVV